MSLGALYQQDIDRALDTRAAAPVEPAKPKPAPERSLWGAALRGLQAMGAEVLADVASLGTPLAAAEGQALPDAGGLSAVRQRQRERAGQFARGMRDVSAELRADAATAGMAENLVFQATRGISKAAAAVVTLGPVAGAAAFGGSEATASFDEMKREGVDDATAAKVAAVSGVAGAAGVLLPMVGPTVKATVGLYALGGPGAFVAQQAATRQVLEAADFNELAQRYDPFDPTGLAMAAAIPLPFAAMGIRGNLKAAASKAKPGAAAAMEPPPEPVQAAPLVTPEQIDAAMVHNLTLVREATRAAAPPPDAVPVLPTLADEIEVPPRVTGEVPATSPPDIAAPRGPDFGPLANTVDAARREFTSFLDAGPGTDLGRFLDARQMDPAVRNLVVGMSENADTPQRLAALLSRVADEAGKPGKAAVDATADAVEGMRALTPEQLQQIETPPKPATDPMLQSVSDRVQALETNAPDMPTRVSDDGAPVRLADDLAAVRRLAEEGDDLTLGRLDADLVRVAAQCALSVGTA